MPSVTVSNIVNRRSKAARIASAVNCPWTRNDDRSAASKLCSLHYVAHADILAQARESLRAGDTLAVWKLDRLGRSVKHLIDLVGELQQHGIQFKSLTDSIDTGTPSGRFFFHVMASLAEMERELIVERTRAGLEIARQLGRTGGRKRQMTDSKIKAAKKLLASGLPARDVAGNLGVSVPT